MLNANTKLDKKFKRNQNSKVGLREYILFEKNWFLSNYYFLLSVGIECLIQGFWVLLEMRRRDSIILTFSGVDCAVSAKAKLHHHKLVPSHTSGRKGRDSSSSSSEVSFRLRLRS